MYNLDFLNIGETFPPLQEAKRVGAYAEYDLMFDGNTHAVEEQHFKQTLRNLNKLALLLGWSDKYVSVEFNYFKLLSKKTADFVFSEPPAVNSSSSDAARKDKQQAIIDTIRQKTNFDLKGFDTIIDVSKYGQCYWRVYGEQSAEMKFTVVSPASIYRVVNEEDEYDTQCYVVAWITQQNTLKIQIHYKGYYEVREHLVSYASMPKMEKYLKNRFNDRYRTYDGNNDKSDLYTLLCDRWTDEVFRYTGWVIGNPVKTAQRINTGLDDFAIIELSNLPASDRSHGTSDYDDIDSIVAQMERTMTQVQLIFDKFTVPTAYGPEEALGDNNGEGVFEIGKYLITPEGGTIPGFLQPDLTRLEYYFRQLEFNVARLKELSEMGAAFTADASVANVAVETMKATYTSALKKASRITSRNTEAVKRLFSILSDSYGEHINVEDITVTWYDGLPNDEEKDIRTASSAIASGLSSRKREYIDRFDHTEDQFDDMWQEFLNEESDLNTVRAAGFLNPFNQQDAASSEGEDADEDDDGESNDGGGDPPSNDSGEAAEPNNEGGNE